MRICDIMRAAFRGYKSVEVAHDLSHCKGQGEMIVGEELSCAQQGALLPRRRRAIIVNVQADIFDLSMTAPQNGP